VIAQLVLFGDEILHEFVLGEPGRVLNFRQALARVLDGRP
jgi:hypothetical protein